MAKEEKKQGEEKSSGAKILNFRQNEVSSPSLKNSSLKARADEEQPAAETEAAPDLGSATFGIQPEDSLAAFSFEDKSPVASELALYKRRNPGAKEFDDFARGIQSWFNMLEMEAIKRFHDIHLDPIVEAYEEYVMRAAEALSDFIMKALLLCRLKCCRRAARKISEIALKAIEKMLDDLGRTVPLEKLFTWKVVEELLAEDAAYQPA